MQLNIFNLSIVLLLLTKVLSYYLFPSSSFNEKTNKIQIRNHTYKLSKSKQSPVNKKQGTASSLILNLIRLDLSLIGYNDTKYNEICDIYILEKQDLSRVSELTLVCFNKSIYPEEQVNDSAIHKLVINTIKNTGNFDSYFSNYLGFWNRCGRRLIKPTIDISIDSLILVAVAKKSYRNIDNSLLEKNGKVNNRLNYNNDFKYNLLNNNNNNINENIISVIELGLEIPNGLLSTSLRNPLSWLYEDINGKEYQLKQPYLCNLCVSNTYRRLGIGKYMCSIVEYISLYIWNKEYIGLHVEDDNDKAQNLYTNLGYSLTNILTVKEKIFNNMQNILYYKKKL